MFAFRRIGENEAIHDAKDQTRASAFWAIDPKLIDRVLESDRRRCAISTGSSGRGSCGTPRSFA